MGKTLPTPYPGQSIDEYREQLVNFQKNYWSFLKSPKGGSKFIPLPPLNLKNNKMTEKKTKVESEKKIKKPTPPPSQIIKEGEDPKPAVKKKKPYYRKKYNKPKQVEIISEPLKTKNNFWVGFGLGVFLTSTVIGLILILICGYIF